MTFIGRQLFLPGWLILAALSLPLKAQNLEYEHPEGPTNQVIRKSSKTLYLSPGESFSILVKDTIPSHFSFEIDEILLAEEPETHLLTDDRQNHTLSHIHKEGVGTYILNVQYKGTKPRDDDGLQNFDLIIPVVTAGWDVDFTGGFTFDFLVDPRFAIESENDSASEQSVIVRNESAEDTLNLGVGAFLHIYTRQTPRFAWSFGLGINEGSDATYFLGPTYRFSNRAAITAGAAFGSVNRLPAGTKLGDFVQDANVLQQLDNRVDVKFFFSVTFGFLGDRSIFEDRTEGSTQEDQ